MKTINATKYLPLLFVAILSMGGCSTSHFPGVYRIDVDQGSIINPDQMDQVAVGMTKRQIQYLLGTPSIQDPFNPDRWDYFYSYETGKGLITRESVTLFFDGDLLTRIEKRDYPATKRKF